MEKSMIGAFGNWAAEIVGDEPPKLSLRSGGWEEIETWRKIAIARTSECLARPNTGGTPIAEIKDQFEYDGLHVEVLSWQLPYGPPTEAYFLKPIGATKKLPAILALHDHGGNKYFGKRKIAQISDDRHPIMVEHHNHGYGGVAWANEIAKRGYAVLIHDAFAFASRRVLLSDVPDHIRQNLTDDDPEESTQINAYNRWAGGHESIMAKSLFCAGTTWPGVFLAEDQRALDLLCGRDDVDANRIGCGGLSGGGLRTVMLGGLDPRIKCAVCVGMMTTWRDYLLNKCHTHTWMIYVPLLPLDLDYPEILGLRVPLPTLAQFDIDDGLFTLPEMKRSDQILREVYQRADADQFYRGTFYPGPHKFDLEMQAEAFDWFDQWLK